MNLENVTVEVRAGFGLSTFAYLCPKERKWKLQAKGFEKQSWNTPGDAINHYINVCSANSKAA